MNKLALLTLITTLIFTGCSTISQQSAEREARSLLESVEAGESKTAVAASARPFIFEGEILVSQGLVSDLWTGLAGMNFSEASLDRIALVDEESFLYFRDSWEAATWFQNYTDPQTVLVFYNWQGRELVLVVDRNRKSEARIQGFGEAAR